MPSTSLDKRRFTSGKLWFTTLPGLVGRVTLYPANGTDDAIVREILPELMSQIVLLLSGNELDQQEVIYTTK